MIKSILFAINIVGLLLIGTFQQTEVEISHNPPASLNPGAEAVVTVNIDKSDVSGFAKYQVSLPEGMSAEAVETSGASFTFNDGKAKFIWMALPAAKSFTLKYRLIADENASGLMELNSRFSYIYNNERKNYDLPDVNITVGSATDLTAQMIKKGLEAKANNEEATASVERSISSTGVNQWKVDLIITKSNLSGFAKIEENLPEGYTVIDLKSSSAVFTVEDNKVKYIWYDLPENQPVTVSYKMLPVIAMEAKTPEINGEFSYLKSEETITIPIGASAEEILAENPNAAIKDTSAASVTTAEIAGNTESHKSAEPTAPAASTEPKETVEVMDESIAEATPVKKAEPQVKQAETTVKKADTPVKKQEPAPKQDNQTASAKSYTDGNIVDVPEPETGVFYRVQIAAGKNNLKRDVFAKLYNFTEDYKLESGNGLFKYTTGYHQVYKAARDSRERITAAYDKFKGPFVTAYNDGERITVQEALMITNQKWYQ